jgi:LEA14-like dessication related protein
LRYERGDGMIRQSIGNRMPTVRRAVFAAALLVAACVPFGQQFASPEVTLESLRIMRIVDAKAELSIGLRVYNPNPYALPVDKVEFDVQIDGRSAVSGRSVHVDALPPQGDAKVEMSGRVDVTAVATALMTIGSQLPVDYVVAGTITLTDGTALPFVRKGRIPVVRLDRGFGPRQQ